MGQGLTDIRVFQLRDKSHLKELLKRIRVLNLTIKVLFKSI